MRTTFAIPLAHEQIKQKLIRQFTHAAPPGTRLPSLRELARQHRVGMATAQRAVREMVEDGLLVSKPKHGTFIARSLRSPTLLRRPFGAGPAQGEPRAGARATLAGQEIIIPFVESGDLDGMMRAMHKGFADMVEAMGATTRVCHYRRPQINSLLTSNPARLIALIQPAYHPDIVIRPDQLMIVISTTALVSIASPGRYDLVLAEEENGGFLAGHCLREAGCRHAGFIGAVDMRDRSRLDETSVVRLRGFERAWGASVSSAYHLRCLAYSVPEPAHFFDQFLAMNPRPDAVFAASDELAVGFVVAARAHGLVAGRDYCIVGFDGQQRGREMRGGPLATVVVSAMEMGAKAAEFLAERVADPDQAVRRLSLGCSFFKGATVWDEPPGPQP